MVPLLEHYAFAAVLLTAVVLHRIFFIGLDQRQSADRGPGAVVHADPGGRRRRAGAGRHAQRHARGRRHRRRAGERRVPRAVPRSAGAGAAAAAAARPSPDEAAWIALRATLIVMPVFVLALTNPSFYLAAVMKTVALAQQAGETDARSAGRELVGATLMGAAIAAAVWTGLSIWPSLWMLMLWLMAAALWIGSAMFGVRRTKWRPSFWSNALITTFLLLGPAIEDSASGKSVARRLHHAHRASSWVSRSTRGARSGCSSASVPGIHPELPRCTRNRRKRHDAQELPRRRAGHAALPHRAGRGRVLVRPVLRTADRRATRAAPAG